MVEVADKARDPDIYHLETHHRWDNIRADSIQIGVVAGSLITFT